jgi:peptidoglycan/LPS O-acetylase OafA/YrhL
MAEEKTPKAHKAHSARVNEIDLLRFIAALMVVIFHYAFRGQAQGEKSPMKYPLLDGVAQYGYLGVELFFMISGFVILMTAANGDLRRFVSSRVVRLYPAFWVACALTFLITLTFGGPRFTATWGQWAANMTLMAEFLSVASIDGAYWSLYVEMRFYLLVAIVLWFGGIARAEICANGSSQTMRRSSSAARCFFWFGKAAQLGGDGL